MNDTTDASPSFPAYVATRQRAVSSPPTTTSDTVTENHHRKSHHQSRHRSNHRGRRKTTVPAVTRGLEEETRLITPWDILKYHLDTLALPPPKKRPDENEHTDRAGLTIPHGFQCLRSIHASPSKVLYISSTNLDNFAVVEHNNVQLIRGSSRTMSYPTDIQSNPLGGLSGWIFVKPWKVTIISTHFLEIKLLGLSMEVLEVISVSHPVLCMSFNEQHEELIIGCVGHIKVYPFAKIVKSGQVTYKILPPRLILSDIDPDGWVSHVHYDKITHRLFAAVDTSLAIFEYTDGGRIELMRDIHELSISSMCFYQPLQYLVTASRDSTVKVWTRHHCLIYNLKESDQSQAPISGAIIPTTGQSGQQTLPFVIASSTDGFLRLWNLDNGHCIYKIQTTKGIIGLGWMRHDTFFHFTKHEISIWNLNRFFSTFTYLQQPVTFLRRVSMGERLGSRILAGVENGAVKLVSSVSGTGLATGFPVIKDTKIKDMEYDPVLGRLWILNHYGDIIVYKAISNPFKVIDEWKYNSGKDQINCITAVRSQPILKSSLYNISNSNSSDVSFHSGPIFAFIAGTNSGQIVCIDIQSMSGKLEVLIQAHTASISSIVCISERMQVISCGDDGTIKIWKLAFRLYDTSQITTESTGVNSSTQLFSIDINPISALSSQYLFTLPDSTTATKIAFDSRSETLAIATSSLSLMMIKLTEKGFDCSVGTHPSNDDHMKSVTAITSLDSLGIMASSSLDGTVRLWDAYDNTLIRELQFHDPLTSVEFCNNRGDLLVGMNDQIALVRIQDYLPSYLLSEILTLPDLWIDDPLETPMTFNSGLDFWELYRLRMEQNGKEVGTWHVSFQKHHDFDDEVQRHIEELEDLLESRMTMRYSSVVKPIYRRKTQSLLSGRENNIERQSSVGQKSILEEEVLESESDSYDSESSKISEESDESFDSSQSYSSDSEDRDVFDDNLNEEYQLSYGGIKREKVKARKTKKEKEGINDSKEGRKVKFKAPDIESFSRRASFIAPGKTFQEIMEERNGAVKKLDKPLTEAQKLRLVEVTRPAFVPQFDKKNPELIAEKRKQMQERMARMGVVLPNSVIMDDVEKEQERMELELRERMKQHEGVEGLESHEVSYALPTFLHRRRTSTLVSHVEYPRENQEDYVDLEEIETPEMSENAYDFMAEQTALMEARLAAEEEAERAKEERLKAEKLKKQAEEEERLLRLKEEQERQELLLQEQRRIQAEEEEKERLRLEEERKEMERLAQEEAERERIHKLEQKRLQDMIRKQAKIKKPKSPPSFNDDLDNTEEDIVTPIKRPFVTPKPPKVKKTITPSKVEKPVQKTATVEMKPAPVLPILPPQSKPIITPTLPKIILPVEEKPVPAILEKIQKVDNIPEKRMDEAKIAWNIVKTASQANLTNIPQPISIIDSENELFSDIETVSSGKNSSEGSECGDLLTQFLFPGLNGKPFTLQNIVKVLFNIIRHSKSSAPKTESLKALLYLYKTFASDFTDQETEIISPLLDCLHDDDWKFRAQVCLYLGLFGTTSRNVIYMLIWKLKDRHAAVRKAAKKTLTSFGIGSKEALRQAMIDLELLPPDPKMEKSNWLDILISRIQAANRKAIDSRNEQIAQWRSEVDTKLTSPPFKRPVSCIFTQRPNSPLPRVLNSKDNSKELEPRSNNNRRTASPPTQAIRSNQKLQSHIYIESNDSGSIRSSTPVTSRFPATSHEQKFQPSFRSRPTTQKHSTHIYLPELASINEDRQANHYRDVKTMLATTSPAVLPSSLSVLRHSLMNASPPSRGKPVANTSSFADKNHATIFVRARGRTGKASIPSVMEEGMDEVFRIVTVHASELTGESSILPSIRRGTDTTGGAGGMIGMRMDLMHSESSPSAWSVVS